MSADGTSALQCIYAGVALYEAHVTSMPDEPSWQRQLDRCRQHTAGPSATSKNTDRLHLGRS